MNGFLQPLTELENYQLILHALRHNRSPLLASGVIDSQKAHLAWALMENLKRPGLFILDSELKAKELFEDLKYFMGQHVRLYPAKDIIFYTADVRSVDILKQRLAILDEILRYNDATETPFAVVLSIEALFDKLSPREDFEKHIIALREGDEINLAVLASALVLLGYERAPLVEGPGQFAIRGGILDVFSPIASNPARIELWGDEIDSIRLVDLATQRSVEKLAEIRLFPMHEWVYDEAQLQQAIARIQQEWEQARLSFERNGLWEEAAHLTQTVAQVVEKLRENKHCQGIEAYAGYFHANPSTLLEYMPPSTLLFFDEPQRIGQHAQTVLAEYGESIQNRILKGYMLPTQSDIVFDYAHILSKTARFTQLLLTTLTHTIKDFAVHEKYDFVVKSVGVAKNRIDLLEESLRLWRDGGYRILLLSGTRFKGERLQEEIASRGFTAHYCDTLEGATLPKGVVTITRGSIGKGFEYPLLRFVVISDKELFSGEKRAKRTARKQKGAKIESFTDLRIGDYIVHENHGVGIYKGIEQIVVDNVSRDYLKLSYADGGNLYVNTAQMDQIQKYIGGEAARVKLNKLGGADWAKAKTRAKHAVMDLAKDLVALYAKRQEIKGHAYGTDTVWQREFEDQFPFEETDDQLTAIEDVKRDMESGKVMDRLICGDVGYGKTEVAIRAAFKAVQDGKQVAYLVPTTILAQQHYNTFVQRMKDFPIGIEMLSRFRTAKQQKASIEHISKGSSDIVIGTHRLLSKDIKFKNLGLVIVDEEQRFGVTHKEKLKQLRENVDVLTLTATPIPRTLHMSLTGIRDMSILEEPPMERQPVQTYVMEYNPEFVRDAIHRELARGGQVYYLHNRVRNIAEMAGRIQKLVPEANVAYAHGQMTEHELENIMIDFIEGDIDVLVCTTIIETGIDIANVNTIIIHDADYMGLSQLYQLRGRVGRSNRLAYAYLMYRKDKILDEVAEKRLQTIRDFTEFGSGFKIAMRDLEIRGAGNLLGAEQHGHMDTVGYDMYCKLLAEAVRELNGEEAPPSFETVIDIHINAYIPGTFIENEEQKLEIYKKIAAIATRQDYYDIQEEIEDRYGSLPNCVQALLDVALLKARAHTIGITAITQKQQSVVIVFKNDATNVDPLQITQLVKESKGRLAFTAAQNPYLTYKLKNDETTVDISTLTAIVRSLQPAAEE